MYPEEWVNVELTTHQITPEFFYKEHFEISDKAIENKIYLTPLTDRETVAAQLADLAFGYRNKFKYYDALPASARRNRWNTIRSTPKRA